MHVSSRSRGKTSSVNKSVLISLINFLDCAEFDHLTVQLGSIKTCDFVGRELAKVQQCQESGKSGFLKCVGRNFFWWESWWSLVDGGWWALGWDPNGDGGSPCRGSIRAAAGNLASLLPAAIYAAPAMPHIYPPLCLCLCYLSFSFLFVFVFVICLCLCCW